MDVQYSPNICFSTTSGENRTEILQFYLRQYYYLTKLTHTKKTQFVYISVTLADSSSNCPFFQLPTVRMFEMLAHCENTGTETLPPFDDSSVDNVLLQTNADFSHFLNSSTFLDVMW